VPQGSKKIQYQKPSFLGSVWELHKVMWDSNNELKSSHPYDSRPNAWPLMHRGISFWRAKPDTKGIYLIGNPVVWYLGTMSIIAYFIYVFVNLVLQKRKIYFNPSGYFKDMIQGFWYMSFGYLCHYLPFFLMQRQVILNSYSYSFIIICHLYIFLYWLEVHYLI
jgi:dolichyl-phosphate-mannose-protein mannosyltransferase